MQKNEKKFYSIIIEKKNNLQKLNNRKSTKNDIPKFRNSSRNKIINLQGNTSSRFNLYKNYILSINDSKESLVGKEKLFSNFFNLTSNKKNNFINSVQLNINHLRNISTKNIKSKSKIFTPLTNDKDNNPNILHSLIKTPFIKKKFDFIKNKFLLGQKNYFKRFNFRPSFTSKRIYPYLNKKPQKSYEEDKKLKKYFFEPDDINAQTMKEIKDNISIPSIKNMKTIYPRNIIFKKNKFTSIKIKKFNFPSILEKSSKLIFEYKNLADKSKKNEENNKSRKNIDENNNQYLNEISSSESNNSEKKMKHIYKIMKPKYNIKNLNILKGKILSYDKEDIYKRQKIIDNNNTNININNINKSIVIENNALRKKNKIKMNYIKT